MELDWAFRVQAGPSIAQVSVPTPIYVSRPSSGGEGMYCGVAAKEILNIFRWMVPNSSFTVFLHVSDTCAGPSRACLSGILHFPILKVCISATWTW